MSHSIRDLVLDFNTFFCFIQSGKQRDGYWWFSTNMLTLEGEKLYIVTCVVIVLLICFFLAPYIAKLLCAFRYVLNWNASNGSLLCSFYIAALADERIDGSN